MTQQIQLPPVFEVNEAQSGNTIQQLFIPQTIVDGTIASVVRRK